MGFIVSKSRERYLQCGKVNGACEGWTPLNHGPEPPSGTVPIGKVASHKRFSLRFSLPEGL